MDRGTQGRMFYVLYHAGVNYAYFMQYTLTYHAHSSAQVHLHLKCFDGFSDNKIEETARVSVFGMACGGESALTAVDNCSCSTITAVMISSYFLSGSFNPWAGCLEDSIRHD